MVKHPSGNFEISLAHCSAFMPVIVVSMLEITVFTPLSKGRAEGTVIFPDKCHFLHLKPLFQRGVENFVLHFFDFFFSKRLYPVNLYFTYKNDVKIIIIYKING